MSLHDCATNGDLTQLCKLLDAGANINGLNYRGWTPLHSAAWSGHLHIVRALLERGAKKNIKDDFGWTPIHASKSNEISSFIKNFDAFPTKPASD
jgi:ankyrin repeat protein